MRDIFKKKGFFAFFLIFVVLLVGFFIFQNLQIKISDDYVDNRKMSAKKMFVNTCKLIEQSYLEPHFNHQDFSRWEKKYKNEVKDLDDYYVAINTVLASFDDPYSRLLTKDEFSNQNDVLDSKMYGIGITIIYKDNQIEIVNVIKNSPACLAGIRKNDVLLSVNSNAFENIKDVSEVAKFIRQIKDDKLSVVILRDDKKIEKIIERKEIKIDTVEYEIVNKNTGYIKVLSFTSDDTPLDFVNALSDLGDIDSLILDLRGNTGGLLHNALFLSNIFIENGDIVSIVGRDGKENAYSVKDNYFYYDKPLVVLVDALSASASEILCAALKDNDRATIVGTQTYGKGLVQRIYSLPNSMGINLTVAKYLTPNGEDIHKCGITPHHKIEISESDFKKNHDTQLEFAKNLFAKKGVALSS